MPDIKLVIPALVGIAVLVLIAGSIGWLLAHPVVLVLSVGGIGGLFYLLARRRAARNRV
jgi:hypothetical protein